MTLSTLPARIMACTRLSIAALLICGATPTAALAHDGDDHDDPAEEVLMPEIGAPKRDSPPAKAAPVKPPADAKKADAATSPPKKPRRAEAPDNQTRTIVVTGTLDARDRDEAPVRTQVIDRQQLEQRQARNLADAVDYTTGVRVETNCQNCGFTQLRVNGLGGAYTQVLIDGLPSFSALAGVYGLEQLPTELMERVEIVKGGGSSLYGPSAVAGVVNIITRRPRESFARAQVAYEHVGLSAPDLRLSGDAAQVSRDGRHALHLFVSARRREGLDLNDDGFTELTRMRQLAAGATAFAQLVPDGELQLKLTVLREYRRGGDHLDRPPHDAAIAEELHTDRLQAEARWSQRLSPHVRYALGYVMAYTDRRSYYGGGGDDAPTLPDDGVITDELRERFEARRIALGGYGQTRNPMHIADARVIVDYKALGAQQLIAGAQLSVDPVTDRYLAYSREIDATYTVFGAYVQHQWAFASWGESVVGARVDKHSELDAPVLSPRLALLLRPARAVRLRTALATGFRAPQAFDEDLHIETVGGAARLIVNAPDLKPERSMSLAQQASWSHTTASGLRLGAEVNGYWTRLRDAFVLNERDDPDTPEEELLRSNRGETRVLGAELGASISSKRWAARAGWTFEDARSDTPDEDFGRARLFRTPRHYGFLDVVFKRGGLQAQAGVTFTGPMLVPRYDAEADPLEVNTSGWFAVINANVSQAFALDGGALVEPFVGVRNLLDSRQTDLERGATRDAGYIYGPMQPRTVMAGVRLGL